MWELRLRLLQVSKFGSVTFKSQLCAHNLVHCRLCCLLVGQLVFFIFLGCEWNKDVGTSFSLASLTGRLLGPHPLQTQLVFLNNLMPLVEDLFLVVPHESAYKISLALQLLT
jgi:hypothetical protein